MRSPKHFQSPSKPARVYVRRAALSGMIIALVIAIDASLVHLGMHQRFDIRAISFAIGALLFALFVNTEFIEILQPIFRKGKGAKFGYFALAILVAPIALPALLIASFLQYLRADS